MACFKKKKKKKLVEARPRGHSVIWVRKHVRPEILVKGYFFHSGLRASDHSVRHKKKKKRKDVRILNERMFFTVTQKGVWFFKVKNTQLWCCFRGAGRTCLAKKSLSAPPPCPRRYWPWRYEPICRNVMIWAYLKMGVFNPSPAPLPNPLDNSWNASQIFNPIKAINV